MKKALLLVACLITSVSGLAALYIYQFLVTPGPSLPEPTRIVISPGSSLQKTANLLVSEGILARVQPFCLWARFTGQDRQIKSGEYVLSTPLTPRILLNTLIRGQVTHQVVTITEGMTLKQIASKLEVQGFGPQESFLALNTDLQFLTQWNLQSHGLEGYLYPDTYFFSRHTPPAEVLGRMLARLHEVFNPALHHKAKEHGLSPHQTLTLASLVEKEGKREKKKQEGEEKKEKGNIKGDDIRQGSGASKIAKMKDIRKQIDGPGGVTLAALWYCFIR